MRSALRTSRQATGVYRLVAWAWALGQVFGREPVYLGGGGSIPFLRMLAERFPKTQFFVTGVLGPHSNAHGPNEFLHIDYATRLTACVSVVLADHGAHLVNSNGA
jgi:acetylornithine deacetylase/succinyl-diaminopimelate desuccinylase-like protein